MDPRTISIINLYILAISTLLAFTKCISNYDSLSLDSIKNAAATQSAQFQPTSPYQTPQNYPPLCAYPPPSSTPSSTALPPPTHLSTPPSSTALPPPTHPPTPSSPDHAAWCVAKPTVPASTIQQALDYACASGADCRPTQVGGACSQPDTVVAHASYAFNSYWQKNKLSGGTCDFGGSAMIVKVDPSYDQCHFLST